MNTSDDATALTITTIPGATVPQKLYTLENNTAFGGRHKTKVNITPKKNKYLMEEK